MSQRLQDLVSENVVRRTAIERAPILDLIGRTPLLSVRHVLPRGLRAEIVAKAEWFNPGGSIKDRPALAMILDGITTGNLTPGKTIIDATSGNTGIAYAMVGAALGYDVMVCLPENANEERVRLLKAYGAKLITTDPMLGSDGAILEARARVAADPERWFYPDQYNNPANWQAHSLTTGPEIWDQTVGRVSHFVTGLGTTGTFMGVGRFLERCHPHVKRIAMQPAEPLHGLEGLKHLATAIVPGIYDANLADENITVETDEAHDMVKRLAREEGVLVGISSAANLVAAIRVAQRLESGLVATIFCDGGDRYLSERIWTEDDP